MEDDHQVSALDRIVSRLEHSRESNPRVKSYAVHARLREDIYIMVEALTWYAGTSRNVIVNHLLDVGIERTLRALSLEVQEELMERQEFLRDHLSGKKLEVVEE